MAVELALHEVARDGGHVDGDERSAGPGRVGVDGAGDELLAGAALAHEQDGHLRPRHPPDLLVDVDHRRRAADEHVGERERLGRPVLAARPGAHRLGGRGGSPSGPTERSFTSRSTRARSKGFPR